ncbi:MAG: hypothetical protein Q7T11_08955 [Deltaproteobacteria bacterium]|nr:hypothetical protein [Deltaproteobacteria bacterium]
MTHGRYRLELVEGADTRLIEEVPALCLPQAPDSPPEQKQFITHFDIQERITATIGTAPPATLKAPLQGLVDSFAKKISPDHVIDTLKEQAAVSILFSGIDFLLVEDFAKRSGNVGAWLGATAEEASALVRYLDRNDSSPPDSLEWYSLGDENVLKRWAADLPKELPLLMSHLADICGSKPVYKTVLQKYMDTVPKNVTASFLSDVLNAADREPDDGALRVYFYGTESEPPAPIIEYFYEREDILYAQYGEEPSILERLVANAHPYVLDLLRMILNPPDENDPVSGKRWDHLYAENFDSEPFRRTLHFLLDAKQSDVSRKPEVESFASEVKEYLARHLFEGGDVYSGSLLFCLGYEKDKNWNGDRFVILDNEWRQENWEEREGMEPQLRNLASFFSHPTFANSDGLQWSHPAAVFRHLASKGYRSAMDRLTEVVASGGPHVERALDELGLLLQFSGTNESPRRVSGLIPQEIEEAVGDYFDRDLPVEAPLNYYKEYKKQKETNRACMGNDVYFVLHYVLPLDWGRELKHLYESLTAFAGGKESYCMDGVVKVLSRLDKNDSYQSYRTLQKDPLSLLEKAVIRQWPGDYEAREAIISNLRSSVHKDNPDYQWRHLESLFRIAESDEINFLTRQRVLDVLIPMAAVDEELREKLVGIRLKGLKQDAAEKNDDGNPCWRAEALPLFMELAALGHEEAIDYLLDGFEEEANDKINLLLEMVKEEGCRFQRRIVEIAMLEALENRNIEIQMLAFEIVEAAARKNRPSGWIAVLTIAENGEFLAEVAVELLLGFHGEKTPELNEARYQYDRNFADQIRGAKDWEIYRVDAERLKNLGHGWSLEAYWDRQAEENEKQKKMKGRGGPDGKPDAPVIEEWVEGNPPPVPRPLFPETRHSSTVIPPSTSSRRNISSEPNSSAAASSASMGLNDTLLTALYLLDELYAMALNASYPEKERGEALKSLQLMTLLFPEEGSIYFWQIIDEAKGKIRTEAVRLFDELADKETINEEFLENLIAFYPDTLLLLSDIPLSLAVIRQYFSQFCAAHPQEAVCES